MWVVWLFFCFWVWLVWQRHMCYICHMPKLIFVASAEEKTAWVEASHDERVSLSEWLRRAANARVGGLGAVGGAAVSRHDTEGSYPLPDSQSSVGLSGRKDMGSHSDGLAPSRPSAAPSPLKPHRPDPKAKASQEHGRGEKKTVKGLCPHRVPLGSFCRRCTDRVAE